MRRKPVHGLAVALFDTRLKGPMFLWGSAAKTAADLLKQAGFDLIMPPESLLVKGMKEPHLDEGEEEHAKTWAIQLGKRADYPGTRVMIGQ